MLVLFAVLLLLPASGYGADQIVDLGAGVEPIGPPVYVNGQLEQLTLTGVWADGAVTPFPSAPSGSFQPAAMNSSGLVVGRDFRAGYSASGGAENESPAYWDSQHSGSIVEVPLSGSINGQPVYSGDFEAVDAAGEAVGFASDANPQSESDFAGLYAPAPAGLPGTPQIQSTLGGTAVREITGISAGYELAIESDGHLDQGVLDRSTGVLAATDLFSGEGDSVSMGPDGAIIGYATGGSALRLPDGTETTLQTPPTGDGAVPFSVNAAHVSVGLTYASNNSGNLAAEWDSHGNGTLLAAALPAGSGWTLEKATGIDDLGDISGLGTLNGNPSQYHGFLMRVPLAPTPPVVNSTGDGAAENAGANGCNTGQTVTDSSGHQVPECTLRAAIQAENAGTVPQTSITFALPGSSTGIAPAAALPALTTAGVTISGTGVTLSGAALGGSAIGLALAGAHDTVTGLTLSGWGTGIKITASGGGDSVSGVSISGPDPTSTAFGTSIGVDIESSPSNTVGGTTAATGDTLAGLGIGVQINGAGATANTVQGDQIGTPGAPDTDGISVTDASGTTIGGPSSSPGSSPGNVIIPDLGHGINVIGINATVSGTTIAGNTVGLAPGGTSRSAIADQGIVISGLVQNTAIGGSSPTSANAIAGAKSDDIDVDGTSVTGTQILGNTIGTNAQGTATVDSSEQVGIAVEGASHTQIGTSGAPNVITGAQGYGIYVTPTTTKETIRATGAPAPGTTTVQTSSMGTVIAGNVIGPLADGKTLPAQIQHIGVDLAGTGDVLGPANEISGNSYGVYLGGSNEEVVGNHIGTDNTGLRALPNVVGVDAPKGGGAGLQIGVPGATPNTISGNDATQVLLDSSASIQNNLIGTTTSGAGALAPFTGTLPDALQGKRQNAAVIVDAGLTATTTIGGQKPVAGNVISGNPSGAVSLGSTAIVENNRIGIASTSTAAVPNAGTGISVAKASLVGASPTSGLTVGGNLIANETGGGILVRPGAGSTPLLSNQLTQNSGYGIRNETAGVPAAPTLGAILDADGHGTHVQIDTKAAGVGTIVQIYKTTECGTTVQGQTLLASVTYNKAQAADGSIIVRLARTQAVGTELTATLTTTGGDIQTSGFGPCAAVGPAPKVGTPAVKGSTVVVPIDCTSAEGCSDITVEETVTISNAGTDERSLSAEPSESKKKPKPTPKKVTRTITVAKLAVHLKARRQARVALRLNPAGRRLLAHARSGHLSTQLQVSAHQVVLEHRRVRLRRGRH